MVRIGKAIFSLLIILSSLVLLPSSPAYSIVPHLIDYQGRLTDSNGVPLNGSYSVTFRIYDAESLGNLLWEETHTGVVIQKGIFSILLGSVKNLDLPFDKQYFLEIKVGDEVLSPRQKITSAGYAMRAEKADALEMSAQKGDILYYNGSAWTRLPAGTSGNFLKTQGTGADPIWATLGNITLDTSGYIRGGQTDYNTGTGFFLGYSGAAYKFSIGNPAGDYMAWNGSDLIISGSGLENSPGETLLAVANTSGISKSSATPVKFLEFVVAARGGLRIKWQAAIAYLDTGYMRIYRNGTPVGVIHTLASSGNPTYITEDIAGWKNGDLLQFYGWTRTGTQGVDVTMARFSLGFAEGKIAAIYNSSWSETAF